jgi:UDP-N-acetylmuramoyl-L-alanyl-D-glutamate--2,6-diaminopimelate ligase
MRVIVTSFWKIFKATLVGKVLRKVASQRAVNLFEHLPIAILANIIYGFPSRKLKVIGVTGTDGKTTTVNMIYHVLKESGKKVSMVSTINAAIGKKSFDTGFHVTSPHSFTIQEFIKRAVESGSEYIVLEVTSHSLDQFRFLGIKFDIAVLTNVTHEHLDYHKTFDNYFKTKLKLVKSARVAIVNRSIKGIKDLSGKVITFGLKQGEVNQIDLNLKLKLPGEYNIENGLAAAAVCLELGVSLKVIKKALSNFNNLSGRMESVENKKNLEIVIDFAHTPNGLENALLTLKSKTNGGRLISLIGAEGYRDIKKRPMLGAIAQKISDVVIVTAVDPRGQIKEINKQIKKGSMKAGAKSGQNFYIIEDRAKAIKFAINQLSKKGDTIGIFGKGHEKSMNINGREEVPWSDLAAVQKILNG